MATQSSNDFVPAWIWTILQLRKAFPSNLSMVEIGRALQGSSEAFLFAASGVALLLPRQLVSASKWAANLMRQSTHQHKTNISSLSHSSSWFILSFPLSTQDNFSKRNPTKSCSNLRTQCVTMTSIAGINTCHLFCLRIFSHSSPVSYRIV